MAEVTERQGHILSWWHVPLKCWPDFVRVMLVNELNAIVRASGLEVCKFRSWQRCAYVAGVAPRSRTTAAHIFDVNPHFGMDALAHFARTVGTRRVSRREDREAHIGIHRFARFCGLCTWNVNGMVTDAQCETILP